MDSLIALPVFLVIGGVVIRMITQSHRDDSGWLFKTLMSAYAIRLAVATMFAIWPESRAFHDDADGYEMLGVAICSGWRGEGPPIGMDILSQNYGYPYVTAAAYCVFGRYRVVASYVNALLGTAIVYLVYQLAREFFHRLVARRAAQLTAFVPSMVLWSSLALKDTPVTFLIVFCLASCVRLRKKFSVRSLINTIWPVVAVQPLRFYVFYFLIFAVCGSLFLERGRKQLSGWSKQVAVIGGVVALLGLVGFAGGTKQGLDFFSLESVSNFRHGMATTANSGFAENADISTPGGALAFLPIGLSVLMLGPFPWQFTSLRALFAAPEVIFWWSLFPSFLRGLRFVMRKRFAQCSPILLFAVTLTCSYSLVHGNVGSGFRQRAQIFVLLFIFTGLGWYQKKCQRLGVDDRELLLEEPVKS